MHNHHLHQASAAAAAVVQARAAMRHYQQVSELDDSFLFTISLCVCSRFDALFFLLFALRLRSLTYARCALERRCTQWQCLFSSFVEWWLRFIVICPCHSKVQCTEPNAWLSRNDRWCNLVACVCVCEHSFCNRTTAVDVENTHEWSQSINSIRPFTISDSNSSEKEGRKQRVLT